jgi:hypothetical protein
VVSPSCDATAALSQPVSAISSGTNEAGDAGCPGDAGGLFVAHGGNGGSSSDVVQMTNPARCVSRGSGLQIDLGMAGSPYTLPAAFTG